MEDETRSAILRHVSVPLSTACALVAIVAFDDAHLSLRVPTGDETCYLHAARQLNGGEPAYAAACYVYPPLLAHVLAAGLRWLGESGTVLGLRFANQLAIALTCALCARLFSPRLLPGIVLSCLLAVAPPAAEAVRFGNISGLATGCAVLGLSIWTHQPRTAGFWLAASILLKPLFAPAAGIVFLSASAARRRTAWELVLYTAAFGVVLALPGFPWLSSWLTQGKSLGGLTGSYNMALSNVLLVFGVPHGNWLLVGCVFALSGLLAWRLRPAPEHVLVLACAASLAASPVVWRHTLIVAYPCLVACAAQLRAARTSVGLLVAGALSIVVTLVNDFFVVHRVVSPKLWLLTYLPVACAPFVATFVALRERSARPEAAPLEGDPE